MEGWSASSSIYITWLSSTDGTNFGDGAAACEKQQCFIHSPGIKPIFNTNFRRLDETKSGVRRTDNLD